MDASLRSVEVLQGFKRQDCSPAENFRASFTFMREPHDSRGEVLSEQIGAYRREGGVAAADVMPCSLENLLEEGKRVRIEAAVRAERSRSRHRTLLGKPNVRW
jgi:hypothetical protein